MERQAPNAGLELYPAVPCRSHPGSSVFALCEFAGPARGSARSALFGPTAGGEIGPLERTQVWRTHPGWEQSFLHLVVCIPAPNYILPFAFSGGDAPVDPGIIFAMVALVGLSDRPVYLLVAGYVNHGSFL